MEDAYWGTKRKTRPRSSSQTPNDGLDGESQETIGSQRMEFMEQWVMILLRLNPGTSSYMIMKLTHQTDGVTVAIKSYTLRNLKQTVINKIVHAI